MGVLVEVPTVFHVWEVVGCQCNAAWVDLPCQVEQHYDAQLSQCQCCCSYAVEERQKDDRAVGRLASGLADDSFAFVGYVGSSGLDGQRRCWDAPWEQLRFDSWRVIGA